MKKIYKVVIEYGYWCSEDNQYRYMKSWEFFSSKKAALQFIDAREEERCYAKYNLPSAKVYVMEADYGGRFYHRNEPILNFAFSHD